MASYNERVDELNEVTQERDDIKKQYDEWRKKRPVVIHSFGLLFLYLGIILRLGLTISRHMISG